MFRSKHTPATVDTSIVPLPDQCSPLCVTPESVLTAIKSFAESSSGGVDGLRPGHIRDLVSMDANEPGYRLLNYISRLANHILNGNLSYSSLDTLFASSFTALRKKDGGIRPITVDSVFRRIANKFARRSVRTRVSEQLRPVQVGFRIAGGAEAAVHATRKFINDARPHDIIVKICIRNAFNSIRMDHILEKSITTCPGICRLIHCAYSTQSASLIGDKIIAYYSDVQQGDPLGLRLFALAVNDIAHSFGTPLSIWHLDDAKIGGPPESVIYSYSKIVAILQFHGSGSKHLQHRGHFYSTESWKSVVHSIKDAK